MGSFRFAFVLLTFLVSLTQSKPLEEREYLVVGVSGGLQDGFPEHPKLHYHFGLEDESKAIFLGRALVHGYKAYLDVMQEGWRQYVPEPGQPLINSVVMASGCHEHANEYWVYIVDSRQVFSVLGNEPRFLSITPDTGLIDLNADETYPAVRDFALHQIKAQGKSDMGHVALPLVTAVWYHESFVPSPPIHVKDDGTEVTNFPGSLALWAGVNDEDRTFSCGSEECPSDTTADAQQRYWDGIRKAIRTGEENRPSEEEHRANGVPFQCKTKARFGAGPETARINYAFTAKSISDVLLDIGLEADFAAGQVSSL